MSIPFQGMFVVRGELQIIMTAMKRNNRAWSSNSYYQNENPDKLTKSFLKLKEELLMVEDLRLVKPNVFLDPFLDVIRSEETTGPITSLALSAVNKFLSYGLIDPTNSNLAAIVENIADAVTHARFVGADQASDGVVLLKIIQVLKTLLLSPEGSALTNESVCEIILSCFRICFETRLNELLRRTAEHALKEMILLLFMRLPQFVEDSNTFNMKSLKIRPDDPNSSQSKDKVKDDVVTPKPVTPVVGEQAQVNADETSTKSENLESTEKTEDQQDATQDSEDTKLLENPENPETLQNFETQPEDYINSVGVRFTSGDGDPLTPYGIPCIRELFRFLISLCNPLDTQNTDAIMHISLNLLTIVFEVAADNIGNYYSLIGLVKDELCRNLFGLLNSERLSIFSANLQVCFLLFESLRSHLKLQLEYYLVKLTDIISSENARITYEFRELTLDNLLQLLRVPGFASELYINYDCNLYCENLFENITKLLSKNTLSAQQAIYSAHILSLDALLTIVASIDKNCKSYRKGNAVTYKRHSRNNSSATKELTLPVSKDDPVYIKSVDTFIQYNKMNTRFSGKLKVGEHINEEQLTSLKTKKRILSQGTELFNQRPEKGIQFLQENGILNSTLDPLEIAHFLRESPGLDKKMIGEYISKKKNVESRILEVFVNSFDFTATRIDKALRLYLETFRLPGEAPLIFLVMEHFADHWHNCNNAPFFNTDAAFRLAYAIIMLNMDQHNHNAKKLNIPMTVDDFIKNLRGLNGSEDFDPEMLAQVYHAIKNEEIIMPAEQTGFVRESYLWKVLLRRGEGKDGDFNHVLDSVYDKQLFQLAWGSFLSALGFVFDKTVEVSVTKKVMEGFMHAASISSHYSLHQEFDANILTLCKFTTLYNSSETNDVALSVNFGQNLKARMAIKSIFSYLHEYGDCMRESWKHVVDLIMQLYKLRLLPKALLEVEDFCDPNGKVCMKYEALQLPKTEGSLFSSLYSYLSSEGQRVPTVDEQEIIKTARKCIKECQIDQIIAESKFLHQDSLADLINCQLALIQPPTSHKSLGILYEENLVIFHLEFLTKVLIQNRDRVLPFWPKCSESLHILIVNAAAGEYEGLLHRSTIALFKLAIYLMRNEELSSTILQSLKIYLRLKPKILLHLSMQISIGIYELLKTSAQNIHTEADWAIVFSILECVGAGAAPPEHADQVVSGAKSDGALSEGEEETEIPDRGYISDPEIPLKSHVITPPLGSPQGDNWIIVDQDTEQIAPESPQIPVNYSVVYPCQLLEHSPEALVKCWESLAFVVRNVAHITPYNFEICVRCIRTFVEASLLATARNQKQQLRLARTQSARKTKPTKSGRAEDEKLEKLEKQNEVEQQDFPERYQTIAIQLLDLMHTLHTRTAQIFRWWAEEGGAVTQCTALWSQGWCPLLQGIARISNDYRRQVRTSAITCLQRSLLMHDLQTLSGPEWLGCFRQVLFPLMNHLLHEAPLTHGTDASLIEESRIRIATITSKVFLHHLSPLMTLPHFNELWFEILRFLERFMRLGTDMLYEAVHESLKNMLLVMYSVKAFHNPDGVTFSPLWTNSWICIGGFLPQLKEELFKDDDNPMLHVPVNIRDIPSPLMSPIEEHKPFVVEPEREKEDEKPIPAQSFANNILGQTVDQNNQNYPTLFQPTTQFESLPATDTYEDHADHLSEESIELIIQNDAVKVPESHLTTQNAYPGQQFRNKVPIDIVKSFTPMPTREPQREQNEAQDIYTDYQQDPYNLTLQIEGGVYDQSPSKITSSNVFQSSSYFGGDERIPPGSEMLFNRP